MYFSFTRMTLRFVSGFHLHQMPTGVWPICPTWSKNLGRTLIIKYIPCLFKDLLSLSSLSLIGSRAYNSFSSVSTLREAFLKFSRFFSNFWFSLSKDEFWACTSSTLRWKIGKDICNYNQFLPIIAFQKCELIWLL